MTPQELAELLVRMGCPPGKTLEMASQLDKRARQLAAQRGRRYDQALTHLLSLMRQGWAAQGMAAEEGYEGESATAGEGRDFLRSL